MTVVPKPAPELEGGEPDLSILFGDDDGGGEPKPGELKPGESEKPTYATASDLQSLRAENEKLRQQSENFQMAVIARLSDLVRDRKTPEPASSGSAGTPSLPSTDDVRVALDYAVKNDPGLIPAILDRVNEPKLAAGMRAVEERMVARLDSRDAASVLRSTLQQSYSDDVGDPNSPIIRQTPQMKALIRNLLRGHIQEPQIDEFMKSESGDQLAYLLSAATQPAVVAKREAGRARLDEERRQEHVRRLSQLTGMGSASTGRGSEPTWTDEDEALIDEFSDSMVGVNKKDPNWRAKAKEKILARKKQGSEFLLMDRGTVIGRGA